MYGFLLNMWIMKKVNEVDLEKAVTIGRITSQEKDMIVSTPQNA